jgi:hypothetical protein
VRQLQYPPRINARAFDFVDAYVPFRTEVVDLHTVLRYLLAGSPKTLSDVVVLRGHHPEHAAYTLLLSLEPTVLPAGLGAGEAHIISFGVITAAAPFAHPFPGVSPRFPGEIPRQVRSDLLRVPPAPTTVRQSDFSRLTPPPLRSHLNSTVCLSPTESSDSEAIFDFGPLPSHYQFTTLGLVIQYYFHLCSPETVVLLLSEVRNTTPNQLELDIDLRRFYDSQRLPVPAPVHLDVAPDSPWRPRGANARVDSLADSSVSQAKRPCAQSSPPPT